MKKLAIIGGGHAHVEVLRQFGLNPPNGVEVSLISPDRHTPYSGMLPGLLAGHYTFDQTHIDLAPLAQFAGARFLQTRVVALDPARRMVTLEDGARLGYDIASIDVGSTPPAQQIAGAREHAIAVKPVKQLLSAWEALIARVRAGEVRSLAVVGGGAAGVEMLLAMQHRLTPLRLPALRYALVTDTPRLLVQHAPGVRAALTRSLARKRVEVHCATRIVRMEANTLIAQNDQCICADAVFLCTGAAVPGWLGASGLALNQNKFININNNLQSTSHPDVFAAGDCATVTGRVYPKSGVYAVRQGPPLAQNLRQVFSGEPLVGYEPQPRALALISTGEQHAIASWGPIAFHGNWVWRWKDRIDRKFMAKYRAPWR